MQSLSTYILAHHSSVHCCSGVVSLVKAAAAAAVAAELSEIMRCGVSSLASETAMCGTAVLSIAAVAVAVVVVAWRSSATVSSGCTASSRAGTSFGVTKVGDPGEAVPARAVVGAENTYQTTHHSNTMLTKHSRLTYLVRARRVAQTCASGSESRPHTKLKDANPEIRPAAADTLRFCQFISAAAWSMSAPDVPRLSTT